MQNQTKQPTGDTAAEKLCAAQGPGPAEAAQAARSRAQGIRGGRGRENPGPSQGATAGDSLEPMWLLPRSLRRNLDKLTGASCNGVLDLPLFGCESSIFGTRLHLSICIYIIYRLTYHLDPLHRHAKHETTPPRLIVHSLVLFIQQTCLGTPATS